MAAKLLLAIGGGRSQYFAMWTSSQRCLNALVTWELTSPTVSDPRERRQVGTHNSFYNLFSEVTSTLFCLAVERGKICVCERERENIV